ncbi:Poly(hydroxyalcanoate) granule associated protein (phasin) [compost metagenome]
MVKTTIGKAISLGLGLAAAGKEQIEKTVNELVKKGEVSLQESKELIDDLIRRGDESQQKIEAIVEERVQAILANKGLATTAELAELEKRIQALEDRD